MNNPLTIYELCALEVGDWVWVVDLITQQGQYAQISFYKKLGKVLEGKFYNVIPNMSTYGRTWLAYKNKEQAEILESKAELMPLNEAIDHLRKLIPKLGCGSCADEHKQLLTWLTELCDIKQAEANG